MRLENRWVVGQITEFITVIYNTVNHQMMVFVHCLLLNESRTTVPLQVALRFLCCDRHSRSSVFVSGVRGSRRALSVSATVLRGLFGSTGTSMWEFVFERTSETFGRCWQWSDMWVSVNARGRTLERVLWTAICAYEIGCISNRPDEQRVEATLECCSLIVASVSKETSLWCEVARWACCWCKSPAALPFQCQRWVRPLPPS